MSFIGVIDKHIPAWSRAIISLAAISENIKFVISSDSLCLSAVGNARISYGEIKFSRSYFHEFHPEFATLSDEGIEEDSYSFVIRSRHLLVLFKNLDSSDLYYVHFRTDWSPNCPESIRFKLLIEIKTKKLIVKKYQAAYQPVVKDSIQLPQQYRQELETNEGQVKFIKLEISILKQFLEMIPSATEDFKIEINKENILLNAYTKQIMKDREYLKQPMSVSISLLLEELSGHNIDLSFPNESINFRLKDFRNFINLVRSLEDTKETTSSDIIEVMFKKAGDAIIFEFYHHDYMIVFLQITNNNGPSTNSDQVLKPVQILQNETVRNNGANSKSKANLNLNNSRTNRFFTTTAVTQKENSTEPVLLFVDEDSQNCKKRKISVNNMHEADTDYGSEEDEDLQVQMRGTALGSGNNKGNSNRTHMAHFNDNSIADEGFDSNQEEFGPTQGVDAPNSIFNE